MGNKKKKILIINQIHPTEKANSTQKHWYLQVNTLEAFISEVLFETQDKYTHKIHPANSVQSYLSSGDGNAILS